MMRETNHQREFEFATPSGEALGFRPTVLVIHDDAYVLQQLDQILQAHGAILFAMDAETALYQAQGHRIDLVILGDQVPGMLTTELCACLKAIANSEHACILVATSHHETEHIAHLLAAGASGVIMLPLSPPLLKAQVNTYLKLSHQADLLRSHASVDSLTGVANLEAMNRALAREWQRGYRNGSVIALLMIDIDHFKQYMAFYDQHSVDQCLIAVAATLATTVNRPADLLARYDHHQFVIILPETPLKGALQLAQRACTAVEELKIRHAGSNASPTITVSVGVAAMEPASVGRSKHDLLIKAAEEALHFTKLGGSKSVMAEDNADPSDPSD